MVNTAIDTLRLARWATRRPLMVCGLALVAIWVAVLAQHLARWTTADIADDFINYYSGARLAAAGHAARVYDHAFFHAVELAIAGPGNPNGPDPWIAVRIYSYPPPTLLLSLPLAALPFALGMIVWSLIGYGLNFLLLRRIVDWKVAAIALAAAPAAFFNLQSGQNGFYTAALFAGGLMLVGRAPILAGIAFGCLVYKPQMAVLLPFALLAGRHWSTVLAAAATGLLLVLASLALFGAGTWTGFFAQMALERRLLHVDIVLLQRMPTVFSAVRQFGFPVSLAYAAQLVSAALAVAATTIVWAKPRSTTAVKAAMVAVATFLATPYALDYDAVILVFVAAWFAREAGRTGFLPWERVAVIALMILPMPMVLLARLAALPIGPFVLWAVLLVLFRRSRTDGGLRDRTSELASVRHSALQATADPP